MQFLGITKIYKTVCQQHKTQILIINFYQMKKGLLSILAASAVLVGCQNYDDQFDSLNTQITALKSTVDGLAGVQSDVAALKGLITSLQTEVGSVQSTLSSDLADALAAIEAVEEQVNDVASGEDLAQVQSDLDGVSDNVSDILESNNVYSNDVIVDSEGTLDFAVALGSKLTIVNGSVVFVVNSQMDIAKVQTALDNVGIVVGEFSYMAKSSTVSPVNFDNITSASDVEVAQAGSYSFASLTSAKNVKVGSNYNSKVTGVSMPVLETVTSFTTGSIVDNGGANAIARVTGPAVNHKVSFTKADSIDLNKLKRYGAALELAVDEGGTIGIAALDDVDATGEQSNISLSVEGPSSITIENFKDGTLSFKNVGEVVVNNFEGPFTLDAGVVSFKADKAMSVSTVSATDLEVFEITGITDPDDATDKEGPAVGFDSNSNIRIIKLKGKIDSVVLNNNSDLEEAHTTAEVSGQIQITNNSSLIAVNTKDSKASGVKISGNSDLESVNIETQTIDTTEDADTKVDGTYEVTNNASLLKTTISSNKIHSLTITGNDDMTEIDLTGMSTLGDTTTGRYMGVYANDLTATRATDSNDSVASGLATDEGSYSESAGMKTAKIIADKMVADTKAKVYIYFDTVETFQGENGVNETNDHTFVTTAVVAGVPTYATQKRECTVVHRDADDSVSGKAAIAAKRSFLVTGMGGGAGVMQIVANAAQLYATGSEADLGSGNDNVNVANILTTAALANADAAGITLAATAGAAPVVSIQFSTNDSTDENSATTAIPAAFTTTVSDTFTLTIAGDKAGEVSVAAGTVSDFRDALVNAWNTANGTPALTQWTINSPGNDLITFTAKDQGTAQIGKLLAFASSIHTATATNIGYKIYNDYDGNISPAVTSDNGAKGNGIVVTVTADTAGTALSEIGQVGDAEAATARDIDITMTGGTVSHVELTSTFLNNSSLAATTNPYTATNEFPTESRSDVRSAEDAVGGTTSTANKFDRTGWLAD